MSNLGDLSKTAHEADLLHALNAAAASLQRLAHSESAVYRAFCEQITALGLRGGICQLDESSGHLTFQAICYPNRTLAACEKLTGLNARGFSFDPSQVDVYREVLKTGEAIFVPNSGEIICQLVPPVAQPFIGRILKVFSASPAIYAPLIKEGRVTGVLGAVGENLAPSDVPAMEAFARHLSVALDNARLFAALQDEVNEHKQTEKALRESEAKYRELVQNVNSIIFRMDTEGRVTFFNEFAQSFFGYAEDEILGKSIVGMIVPEIDSVGQDMRALIQDIVQSPEQYANNENENMRRNGERIWVSWANRAILDDQERITEILCVGNDITERKNAEAAQRRRANQQEKLLETARHLTGSLEIKEVLARIASGAREILEVLGCAIYLLEKDGKTLTPVVAVEPPHEEEILSTPLDVESSFTGQAIRARRALVFNDAAQNSLGQFIPGTPEEEEERIIVAPFIVDDEVLGAICLNRIGAPFSNEDLALAETFATYAETALKNAQTHNQLQREMQERLRAEGEIRRLKDFNEGIVQSVAEGITVEDSEGFFTFVNPAAATLLGYAPSELVGKRWTEVVPSDQQSIVRAANKKRVNGEADRYELELLRKDGTRLPVIVGGSPRFEEDRFLGTLAAFTDISERAIAEEELRLRNRELGLLNRVIAASASELEAEAILETACRELAMAFDLPQATAALLDPEMTNVVVVAEYLTNGRPSNLDERAPVQGNPWFQYLLTHKGPLVVDDALLTNAHYLSEQDGADQSQKIGLPPIHNPLGQPNIFGVKQQDEAASLLLLPLIIQEEVAGGLALVDCQSRIFTAGEVSLAWGVADQVAGALARARLRLANRELEKQYHQAQKMEAIGLLAGGIAHDFNNLLTAINGFAELMQLQLSLEDPLQELVGTILRSGRRASDLVRQLLVFSRKQIIEPKVLNLNSVVADMDRMLRRIVGEDIQMKAALAPELWSVKIDPTQLEQVIANLVVNARDAMPGGGRLTIETANLVLDGDYVVDHVGTHPGDHVMLAVSDTGVGMSEEVKARIFEPFFTTKEAGKGTGLGLSTVYGIVKQNGGNIWVYSEEGSGTTFKIYLPRAAGAAQTFDQPEFRDELPSGRETILLAEDDAGVRDLAQRVLQMRSYTVLVAENGPEALRISTDHTGPIHLLLTDVVMPGMSGMTLAEQLAQGRPDLKVLFMSGYTDDAVAHHGLLTSGVALLQKPFGPMALARKVQAVLDG